MKQGIPLALVVDGANRHDIKLLVATVDGIVIARPEPTQGAQQHLCLDAAYDADWVRQALHERSYQITFVLAVRRKPKRRRLPAIGHVAGSSSGRTRGSIVRVACSSGGKRKLRIIWLSFS